MKTKLIKDIFPKRMSFSFEVFPPKPDKPLEPLFDVIDKLSLLGPDYFSITYGAGGSNIGRNTEACAYVLKKGVTAMTHFTCVGNTRSDIDEALKGYKKLGVENMLALRGDIPKGWTGTQGDFKYAVDLVGYIRKVAPDFCIAAACCPEKHLQARTLESDIMHLRTKADMGADFLTSQLFYDNGAFFSFLEKARRAGIRVPIVAGLMPALTVNSVIRMTTTNGCSIPRQLSELIGKYGESPEDFKKAGMDYTAEQLAGLVTGGIDGLHIYTMNRWQDVAQIVNMTGLRRFDFGSDT